MRSQVTKMLPGGVGVVGVYTFCEKAVFDGFAKWHEQATKPETDNPLVHVSAVR